MASRVIFNDPHFQSHVCITIAPSEKHRITKVEVSFYRDSQDRDLRFHKIDEVVYKWWVTIPFYTEETEKAFEEIKKEEYVCQGYSEC